MRGSRRTVAIGVAAAVAIALGAVLVADHSWANYHWARTASPFTLTIVNSTTDDWDVYVANAVGDWSQSQKLNMTQDLNGSTSDRDRRQCRTPDGAVRICNQAYGNTGWLGIAGISIDPQGHIVTGYTKLNDTYFSTTFYDNDAWKQSVTCQELGHNIGLDHQDENFNNTSLETCMDYQNPPWPVPNAHDYDQLDTIYAHLDSYNSYTGGGDGGGGTCNAPPGKGCNKAGLPQDNGDRGWGISLGRRGQKEKFLRVDPDGTRHLTFVTWAAGH